MSRATFSTSCRAQWVTSCAVIQMEVVTKKNKFSNRSNRRRTCSSFQKLPLNLSSEHVRTTQGFILARLENPGEDRVLTGEDTGEACLTGNEHRRDLKLPPAASWWRANTQRFPAAEERGHPVSHAWEGTCCFWSRWGRHTPAGLAWFK